MTNFERNMATVVGALLVLSWGIGLPLLVGLGVLEADWLWGLVIAAIACIVFF